MSSDKLVFDLSQEVEGSPNVFIRKDWINIMDNQNQNYQNNQCIIDTSQIANSNKYTSYREAYLAIPLLLTLAVRGDANTPLIAFPANAPPPGNVGIQSTTDYSIGLKNWFGSIIHSITLDYNGTTIIQQTPFCNMWNVFKLMTTLSWGDVATQGATIGFYPDTASSFNYQNLAPPAANDQGIGLCNNDLGIVQNQFSGVQSATGMSWSANNIGGNYGATYRTSCINYRPNAFPTDAPSSYNVFLNSASSTAIWKSYISNSVPTTAANGAVAGTAGCLQITIMATVYLKHLHSFFNMCPLLKGVFMKLTLNLNNTTSTISINQFGDITTYNTQNFVGGVNPLLIPSQRTGSNATWAASINNGNGVRQQYYNISVGANCTDNTVVAACALPAGTCYLAGVASKSVYLYVPTYTFNRAFEQAYTANNVKQIKYTDIYQYQVLNVASDANFNNLITNGIANIKSVLIVPYLATNPGFPNVPTSQFLSPFDTAGCGTTAPLTNFTNFNIQISGQNAIYNMQRYAFEEWNNQLYGQNAVNGGMTDGLTSGLINFNDFQNLYCYYYVNVERMLPVEQSVPKSVQIIGQNKNGQALDFYVFVEYGVGVNIDVITGARV